MNARLAMVEDDSRQVGRFAASLRGDALGAHHEDEAHLELNPGGPPAKIAADSSRLFGQSAAMSRLRELIGRVASASATVLIQGETGTGKELAARALHNLSSRSKGPFIPVDCAALPTTLLESELFGHAKGAFTDAKANKHGLFAEAAGGTLFFDEVAELSLDGQAKLLRALQERRVRPVGTTSEVRFDARVMCATHKDLEAEVSAGRFRQDLYFRINVLQVVLPPLRTRGADTGNLAQLFLERICERDGQAALTLPQPVLDRLLQHQWPGNVRELENCIENLAALARDGVISVEDLPMSMRSASPADHHEQATDGDEIVSLDQFERRYVLRVLRSVQDNRSRAAKVLGIDRRTLYRKLETWGLPTWRAAPPDRERMPCERPEPS
jgi:two-component system response regulator HydG